MPQELCQHWYGFVMLCKRGSFTICFIVLGVYAFTQPRCTHEHIHAIACDDQLHGLANQSVVFLNGCSYETVASTSIQCAQYGTTNENECQQKVKDISTLLKERRDRGRKWMMPHRIGVRLPHHHVIQRTRTTTTFENGKVGGFKISALVRDEILKHLKPKPKLPRGGDCCFDNAFSFSPQTNNVGGQISLLARVGGVGRLDATSASDECLISGQNDQNTLQGATGIKYLLLTSLVFGLCGLCCVGLLCCSQSRTGKNPMNPSSSSGSRSGVVGRLISIATEQMNGPSQKSR